MAEEKKTTKKTTTKKKEIVEVKVEKKFCTRCGKELNETLECNCKDTDTTISINVDEITKVCKGFINKIVDMFKKPFDSLKKEVNKNNWKYALVVLVIIAITAGLGVITVISSTIDVNNSLNFNDLIDIPYFKIFIYMILMYVIVSFIIVGITHLFAKILGNKEIDLKKSLCLFAYANIPVIVSNLLIILLNLLGILTWLGTVTGLVISIFSLFNFVLAFLDMVKINDNKKSYVLTGLLLSWLVVSLVIVYLLGGSLLNDIVNEIGLNINGYNNVNNLIKW